MSDPESLPTEAEDADTTMYRPAVGGGLEAGPRADVDYRSRLRAQRWNAAPLKNPEVEKTDPRYAIAAIAILSAVTLVVLVLGYASGFWG